MRVRVAAGRRLPLDHFSDGADVSGIERCVDFIKEIERRRVAALHSKYERQRHQALLTARQLLQQKRIVERAVE